MCCYPDYARLLGAATDHARHALVFSYPARNLLSPALLQEAAARGLGDHGKRDYLLQHSQLKLNAELVAKHEDAWTEDDIRARTDALIARVATIWPRPNVGLQQTGPVALTTERTPDGTTETAEETADDASHMGKYRLLWQWLQDQGRDDIPEC
jgi:hypothetical protein